MEVSETLINKFVDLISKVFQIRDIMPHDLEKVVMPLVCDRSKVLASQLLHLEILPWLLFALLH